MLVAHKGQGAESLNAIQETESLLHSTVPRDICIFTFVYACIYTLLQVYVTSSLSMCLGLYTLCVLHAHTNIDSYTQYMYSMHIHIFSAGIFLEESSELAGPFELPLSHIVCVMFNFVLMTRQKSHQDDL